MVCLGGANCRTRGAPVFHNMDPSERATEIAQLAILLLQAAGIQTAGSDDDEL